MDSTGGTFKRIRRNPVLPKAATGSAGDAEQVTRAAPPPSPLRRCNPWYKYCEGLLSWRILSDAGMARGRETLPVKGVGELPLLFGCEDEYVSKWEALCREEARASILGGISTEVFTRGVRVEITEVADSHRAAASLSKLACGRPTQEGIVAIAADSIANM